jgi:hypothetical protein
MCSKSNPLVVFALDLMSTYEGEHRIFGLLGQANLTQNDVPTTLAMPPVLICTFEMILLDFYILNHPQSLNSNIIMRKK